jgi:hypothetical protein
MTKQIIIPRRISEITRSEYEDAPIRAVDIGEQYNIAGHDVQIEGFATSELSGRIYSKLRGGSLEQVRSVSQDDVDRLKKGLEENIKSSLNREISNSLGEDDILIEQSKASNELAFEYSPQVDSQASTFDITKLELEMSVYTISQADLDSFAAKLITTQANEPVEIQSSKAASISNVQIKEGNIIEFDISKEIKTQQIIDTEGLRTKLAKKKISEAEKIIKEYEGVATFQIDYSPFFVPKFMRKFPSNVNKITIDTN